MRSTRAPDETDEAQDTRVEIAFVPPQWMSNVLFRCLFGSFYGRAHGRLGPVLSITPVSVHQNFQLFEALCSYDVPQLRDLFETGQARPSDMILFPTSCDPITLLEVGHSSPNVFYTVLTNQAT